MWVMQGEGGRSLLHASKYYGWEVHRSVREQGD